MFDSAGTFAIETPRVLLGTRLAKNFPSERAQSRDTRGVEGRPRRTETLFRLLLRDSRRRTSPRGESLNRNASGCKTRLKILQVFLDCEAARDTFQGWSVLRGDGDQPSALIEYLLGDVTALRRKCIPADTWTERSYQRLLRSNGVERNPPSRISSLPSSRLSFSRSPRPMPLQKHFKCLLRVIARRTRFFSNPVG